MIKESDKIQLKQTIGHLSKAKQVAWALLFCERMMPALNRFAKETGFDSSVYREHLDDAWRKADQGTSASDFGEAAKQCLDQAPNTEDFIHPLMSAALNAAISVVETMQFLADNDVNHVVEVAVLARVTAASYAQLMATTPPFALNYDEVVAHPLVQHELQQKADDLEFLEALPADTRAMIPLIKERAARTPLLLPEDGHGRFARKLIEWRRRHDR
jgi:uncharacterized protein YjaG (DUF416 family)